MLRRLGIIIIMVLIISQAALIKAQALVFIHEFLADPAAGFAGDANNDGIRDAYDDEFIELFNQSAEIVDISNWYISDAVSARHYFGSNTFIQPNSTFVVFGGGFPNLPGIVWQTASTGMLSLNNTADTITLRAATGQIIDFYTYGLEAGNDQSLVRNPEASKGEWIKHTDLPYAYGKLFSPGYLVNPIYPPVENIVPEPATMFSLLFGLSSIFLAGKRPMGRIILAVLIMVFLVSSPGFAYFTPVKGLEAADIRSVALSPLESSRLYAGSNNGVYRLDVASNTVATVAVFKEEEVKHIFFDAYIAGRLYIATSRHFYQINENLDKLFAAPDDEAIYTAAKHKGVFYIGTNQGFYEAREDLLRWKKSKNIISAAVYSIDSSTNRIYFATSNGVYALSDTGSMERVFVMRDKEDEDNEQQSLVSRVIKVDVNDENRIWLGTEQGIFVSQDAGKQWKKFFVEGLDNVGVNSFAQIPLQKDEIYVGTNKGFFLINIKSRRSQQLSEGLYSPNIRWVALSPQGKIYLATDQGLFKNDYFAPAYQPNSLLKDISEGEPTIAEVQQCAMRYNEVYPEKIRQWRNALCIRALMPNFNLDYNKTITYDSSADRYFTGPKDWGFSFSWDLGDLIWNNYHDDVDTRSRLNTQLRLDILDEINRVYFERLRLKQEIANTSLNETELFKKQLRLAELTAILDGYTGGFFSKKAASWRGHE